MPVLNNPKHERFAQGLALGKSATEAYEAAGYNPNRHNASRLKTNEHVLARVSEILEAASEKVITHIEVTRETLLAEFEEVRRAALAKDQLGAANQSIMGKARVSGLIIDRREVGDPGEFSEMTDAELVAKAAREARELGISGPVPVDDEGEAA